MTIQLYSADACPFAQRTRALLKHLGVSFEQHIVNLDDRDADFLTLTPTGKVPLLVDGRLKLYESSVINDYLADKHGYADAYDADVGTRARERLAMAMWDRAIVPVFYRSLRDPESFDAAARKTLTAYLKEMIATVQATGKRTGNLLSFHCAPFWARMIWVGELTPVSGAIDEWIDLKSWLDASLALEAVQATLPDRAQTVERYRQKYAAS